MDIRPQDLPELRAEMARLRTVIGPEGIAAFQPDSAISNQFGLSKTALIELETANVRTADLFHVSREMTELATISALSLPMFELDAHDFPAERGLIYFDGGIAANWGAHPVMVYAATWKILTDFGAMLAYYTDAESFCSSMSDRSGADAVIRDHGGTRDGIWPGDIVRTIGKFISKDDARYGETEGIAKDGVAAKVWPVVRAALLLMQQPLARTSEVEADRAARKRISRLGYEPGDVRVIELRRPKNAGGAGDSDREYHHQWIVKGHWRQQWYPAREVHRPVWIAPHIKGPEGAPLIGGEKVYAWKR